ncbi:MAG: ABC transporter permease, partial [Clostridiales bacterium]
MTNTKCTSATFMDKTRYFWYLVKRNPLSMVGLFIILFLIICAIFAPLFTQYEPNSSDIKSMLQAPNSLHILGTDKTGNDI